MNFHVEYKNKNISHDDIQRYCIYLDKTILQFSLILDQLVYLGNQERQTGNKISQRVNSVLTPITVFCLNTYIDCLVYSKYFLLAESDVEKRIFRGNLYVLLNEGFKKLYGFNERQKNKSEWKRIQELSVDFPLCKNDVDRFTAELEELSQYDWWKEHRNCEVHLDGVKLYDMRKEDVKTYQIIADTLPLIECFNGVNKFLTKINHDLILTSISASLV